MSFPWASLIALGIGQLRLSPDDFWKLSPRELLAALGAGRPEGLARADFEALMEQFPDDTGS